MTNKEFDEIVKTEKLFVGKNIKLPMILEHATYLLNAKDSFDGFILDVDRRCKYIEISKHKMQARDNNNKLPLVRIEVDGPPHMNPDGTKIGRNHIHYFNEKYQGDNLPYACEIDKFPGFKFGDYKNFSNLFFDFSEYFNINSSGISSVF